MLQSGPRMRCFWALLLALPLCSQTFIPNRYILQLTSQPIGRSASSAGRDGLHTAAAERRRIAVRAQQNSVRRAVERIHGTVAGRIENTGNLLLVRIPDSQAASLAAIPGVAAVRPVRAFRFLLDHALALHRAIDAWNQVGPSNAGAGIKIGMIDTGIDIGHPGFADASFAAPAGFPLADSTADLAYTNNKVIVARSYASFFTNNDPDPSAADHVGHGTATAMAAAGVANSGPLATITGMAPRAFLGSYKVFGTPGVNDYAPEDAILQAIEDAVNDGMDIINMSLGSSPAPNLVYDSEAQALDMATSLGVIVVAAAGNGGPNPATISSPADSPWVIAAGASNNDRFFAGSVLLPGGKSIAAVAGTGGNSPIPLTGTLVDVAPLDGSGLACASLPANSLAGVIALIFRGTCTFETKLDNAQAAGAAAAIVYDNVPGEDPVTMSVGAAALPAAMVSNANGLALKPQLSSGLNVTLSFSLSPAYTNPARTAAFSSQGPSLNKGIKPDLLAVGMNLYTAAQKLDSNGELYSPAGYAMEQGTSFSSPLVAGAAALLKQARPGLTVDQYRSLLIDTADPASLVPGTAASIQQGGAGVLNVLSAINATAAASPVSLSLGWGGGTFRASGDLTVTNVGTAADTFQLSVTPRTTGAPAPTLPVASVQLNPGSSALIPVRFQAAAAAAGAYDGYIAIQGSLSSVITHVPYWYGVASGQPAYITVLYSVGDGGPQTAGSSLAQAVMFRVTDGSGIPVPLTPSVTATSTGAQATAPAATDPYIPGAFTFDVRLSTQPGNNVFQIQAGSLTATVTIVGQ